MKKIVLLVLLLAGMTSMALGQQDHQYTQFMYNKLPINPAYAGARGVPFITAIYRNQWIGFDGSPSSVLASFNSPFLTPRVGVGVTIGHYQIGLDKDFAASLAYSYDLIPDEAISLRAGIMGSIRSLSMDFSKAVTPDPSGPGGDNSLDPGKVSSVFANVGAGLYFTYDDRIYVGFSVPRIYANTIGINDNPLPAGFQTAKEYQHFYGMVGAVLELSDDINLLPSVLTKYVKNAPFDVDVNVNLEIREKVTAGLSYRVGGNGGGDSMDLLVFWQAHPQFGVGVAYDFSLSDVKDYTAGSIELLLQVDLKQVRSKKKLSNPRFFM
ncbi:MAG: type IX secretion system membrane protein PorP/SprF [Bacteroidetes bacterium]|nr:MAG: type IX secretion system membrane protein PorP/SprF [Bacteroidota bacterium]